MQLFYDIDPLRDYVFNLKNQNRHVAFVPTMGALHKGHESLIKYAQNIADDVIVSIFLNPIQFAPNEDYQNYPRPLQEDIKRCQNLGISALFLPTEQTIYPKNSLSTHVSVPDLSALYCGQSRPHFFQGVTNVVIRLFNIIQPNSAIFGEKDYQQLIIIKTCVNNLFLPISIYGAPIIRNSQGLALSSRNHYLSKQATSEASSIYKSLSMAKQAVLSGITNPTELDSLIQSHLAASITIDYIAYVDSNSLLPVDIVNPGNRILFAGTLNQTRLIDNIAV
tara:strand:- start:12827 stop:13663 length:837 start_codon:yes stop_codon:yes gene_type:complete